MKPTTNTEHTPASSASIEQRIEEERARLVTEKAAESALKDQATPALESGNDSALDKIELQLKECADRQERIEKRIELLQVRHTEALKVEEGERADTLAAEADRIHAYGVELIAAYTKSAQATAEIIGKLEAVDILLRGLATELRQLGKFSVDELTGAFNVYRHASLPSHLGDSGTDIWTATKVFMPALAMGVMSVSAQCDQRQSTSIAKVEADLAKQAAKHVSKAA